MIVITWLHTTWTAVYHLWWLVLPGSAAVVTALVVLDKRDTRSDQASQVPAGEDPAYYVLPGAAERAADILDRREK